jgi:hypothetical protein
VGKKYEGKKADDARAEGGKRLKRIKEKATRGKKGEVYLSLTAVAIYTKI